MKIKFKYIFAGFETILLVTLALNFCFFDGNKIYRILLNMLTVGAVSIIFMKTRLNKYISLYYLAIIFIFFSMYVGNILNIYKFISFYDKILHFISGTILSIIAVTIFNNYYDIYHEKIFTFIFIVSFSIACAGVWEIYEYTTDLLFNLNSQNGSLNDTMQDIICGTLGSLICFIPKVSFLNKNNIIIKYILNANNQIPK